MKRQMERARKEKQRFHEDGMKMRNGEKVGGKVRNE